MLLQIIENDERISLNKKNITIVKVAFDIMGRNKSSKDKGLIRHEIRIYTEALCENITIYQEKYDEEEVIKYYDRIIEWLNYGTADLIIDARPKEVTVIKKCNIEITEKKPCE